MAIHVLDLEFGHLVSSDLYTYRMPSEEKKAEYAATKKAKRHLAKWEADPKTQALQAELRGVRATERFNRAAPLELATSAFGVRGSDLDTVRRSM